MSVSSAVCVCVCVCALKGKRLDLSTQNLVDLQCMAGTQHALTPRSKGQGHAIIKCAFGLDLHVDRTAEVSVLFDGLIDWLVGWLI